MRIFPVKRRERSGYLSRIARMETLERRTLLAADIAISGLAATEGELSVSYQIAEESAEPFTIGIYRSYDGQVLDELVGSVDVSDAGGLTPGNYDRSVSVALAEENVEYQLIAVVDSQNTNQETHEDNNRHTLVDAVFLANDRTLHVVGTPENDAVHVQQFINYHNQEVVQVELNGTYHTFAASDVDAIAVRTFDGDDTIDVLGQNIGATVLAGGGNNIVDQPVATNGNGDDAEDPPLQPPPVTALPEIVSAQATSTQFSTTITGTVEDDGPLDAVTIRVTGALTGTITVAADGTFLGSFVGPVGGFVRLVAIDADGNESDPVELTL